MAKITLVRPPVLGSNFTIVTSTPPIAVAYLAGSLRAAGHQPVIVDGLGEAPFRRTSCFDGRWTATGLPIDEIVARIPADSEAIGVSCMFSQDWPYAHRIVEAIRRKFPRIPLIVGGEHVSAMPLYILENYPAVDLCVIGEGEEAIVEIADCVASGRDLSQLKGIAIRRDGKAVLTPARARLRNLDAIPRPAWDLTPIENYLDNGLAFGVDRGRNIPMLATRGCPYQCTFCSSPTMWTTRWMARDPALVVDEIQDYLDRYRVTNVEFYDLTAVIKKEWILTFCRTIEQRGMKFTFQIPQGTRSEALDAEVCQALYRAGCRNLTYSPESGAPSELKRIKKRVDLKKMLSSMRSAAKVGIRVKAQIVVGFPEQTRREIWQTFTFIMKMALVGVHHVSIYVFSPYPGSELFEQLQQSGKLPELNDEYFLSLASFSDMTMPLSRTENLSNRELGLWRTTAYLAFLATQYAVRPWRAMRTLYNFAANRQESHFDKSIHDFFEQRRARRQAAQLSGNPGGKKPATLAPSRAA
ncbi:MAG: B12-binding domain-containing radical SAM protein [Candidatus Binataceae bacterium]